MLQSLSVSTPKPEMTDVSSTSPLVVVPDTER